MRAIQKRVLIPTAVTAFAAAFFAPPDLFIEIAAAVSVFVGALGILLLSIRFLSLAAWPTGMQQLFSWAVAIAIGVAVCVLPQVILFAFVGGLAALLWLLTQDTTHAA